MQGENPTSPAEAERLEVGLDAVDGATWVGLGFGQG
jgi:hypothetical protein